MLPSRDQSMRDEGIATVYESDTVLQLFNDRLSRFGVCCSKLGEVCRYFRLHV